VAAGTLAKASLVGAKTVKGPVPVEGVSQLADDEGGDEGGEAGTDWASWTMFLAGAAVSLAQLATRQKSTRFIMILYLVMT
jgi:hypothetical protein